MSVQHQGPVPHSRTASALPIRAALALALGATLSGCGGIAMNQQLTSVHQPVVHKSLYSMDLAATPAGIPAAEAGRLADWFDTMHVHYGDRIAIDDPLASPAARAAIEHVAGRYGMLVGHEVPVTEGYVNAGTVRVIIIRSVATVPGCPDWSDNSDFNFNNATGGNYGCAVNGNLAAMIANPEDLIHGRTSGDLDPATATKAISSYRTKASTGTGDLKQNSTK
jgi:pilus assembly protein CpaD